MDSLDSLPFDESIETPLDDRNTISKYFGELEEKNDDNISFNKSKLKVIVFSTMAFAILSSPIIRRLPFIGSGIKGYILRTVLFIIAMIVFSYGDDLF